MLEHTFVERLTELKPTDELTFEMQAEIEALALTRNWVENADEYASEFMALLDDDDHKWIKLLNLGDEVRSHVWRNIQEVSDLLDEGLNQTILEALNFRGEAPSS